MTTLETAAAGRARVVKPIFALALLATLAGCQREEMAIRFEAPGDERVTIGIFAADGALVSEVDPAEADDPLVWNGLDRYGKAAKPGHYTWSAVAYRSFGVRVSGVACRNESSDWMTGPTGAKSWGGTGGLPSAVAADATRVYLGWSGGQVTAVDLEGRVVWSAPLPEGAACEALAVDGETVVALARRGPTAEGLDHLVKLRGATGEVQPWPSGPMLPLTALWPAGAKAQPTLATAMTARSGRTYLTFSDLQFLAVLQTDTGAYLQTVVGPPPGAIDVTPTKSESPDAPGKLVDADFAIVALQGGTLGRVLFAHDPLWVMTSDFQPLDRDERITALALLGDGAPHHAHSVFVGLGAPFHQVQRRSVLSGEGFLWIAGRSGGRAAEGPWDADALGPVRALALDARGQLWVAEGDAVPPRFSVWNTEGNQGRLEREFFGPVSPADTGAAILPSDPEILVGAGCEWRIDPRGGPARCLGVITRDGMAAAGFRTAESGTLLLHVQHPNGTFSVFERRGEGDYVPRERHVSTGESAFSPLSQIVIEQTGMKLNVLPTTPGWLIGTADGLRLGLAMQGLGMIIADLAEFKTSDLSTLAQDAGGKVYAATADRGLFRVEITGLDSIRRVAGGRLVLRAPR